MIITWRFYTLLDGEKICGVQIVEKKHMGWYVILVVRKRNHLHHLMCIGVLSVKYLL